MQNNRRNFLKILGTSILGASASPVIAGVPKLKSPDRTLKVGLLQAQSNLCPEYPASFINGFRLGINQNKALDKRQIEIINEPVGFGTPFLSEQNAKKLIYENKVDLMVGLLGSEVAARFENHFSLKKVPLILCNAGENFPTKPLQVNNYLFFNSLGLFQSSYLTGQYGVTRYGNKACVVTSFYESGYDALFTFYKGVENSGGNTEETILMKMNENDFVTKAISRIREIRPDFVYVFLSGKQAGDFIITYRNDDLNLPPLLTTQFVTDHPFLPALGNFASQLEFYSPWNTHLPQNDNKNFVKKYLGEYRSTPDLFAVLGFETGMLVYQALAACKGDFSGENLASVLSLIRFQSPRGEFSFDSETGWAQIASCRYRMEPGLQTNLPIARMTGTNETIPATYDSFSSLDNPYRSGWLNPYLFV